MSGFLNFFSGKKSPIDLSLIGVDVHSHLLPGIDDGAETLDHSIGMINHFASLGYRKLITTPHVMKEGYANTPEIILGALEQVRNAIEKQAIKIELNAAAEYYFDEGLFEKIEQKNILTFGENCVLFEFSFLQEPIKENELIFSFLTNGYQPVLAHYERYAYYPSIHKAEELREMGVKIQMNLNSLSGHYGPKVQKQAESLIKNKLVDLVGSDCHRIEHLHILKQNLHKANFYRLLDLDLMNYRL